VKIIKRSPQKSWIFYILTRLYYNPYTENITIIRQNRERRMTDDKKEAELRTVYTELDEDRRQKMESLAVNLMNAQNSTQSDKEPPKKNEK
jgi:hypothetical protein